MSKKHFQAFAEAIYRAHLDKPQRDELIAFLVPVFRECNPRFERDRFIEACETGKTKGMRQVA